MASNFAFSAAFKNSSEAFKWLHVNRERWVSQPPEFRKRFNDDYEKFAATLKKYVEGEISDNPMVLTLDEQNAIKQRCKNKCGVEKCGYNASFKEYKETAGETVCYESSQSANETPPKSEPKSRKLSEEDCKKTCQGTNKKCETSNEVGWYCIDLADGEYEKKADCTKACSNGKCEYTKIKNKAKIPYHVFVCKPKEQKEQTAEQEKLKAKIEPDANRIIEAYNKRKAALEAENSK